VQNQQRDERCLRGEAAPPMPIAANSWGQMDSDSFVEQTLQQLVADYPKDCMLQYAQAKTVLQRSLSTLEQSMAQICAGYSKLFLLIGLRSMLIPPGLGGWSPTPSLDLGPIQTVTMAALKYGSTLLEPSLSGEVLFGRFPLTGRQKEDLQRVVLLAFCYHSMEMLWKALGSGAKVGISDGLPIWTPDEQTQYLANLENRRLERGAANILSPSGSMGVLGEYRAVDPGKPVMLIARAVVSQEGSTDTEPLHASIPGYHDGRSFEIHYFPYLFDMSGYVDLLRVYSASFVEEYGFSPNEFATFVSCITLLQRDGNANQSDFFQDFCRTGLGTYSVGPLRAYVARQAGSHASKFGIQTSSVILTRRFFNKLVLDETAFRLLEMHGGWLSSIFYRLGSHIVVDWYLAQHLLNAMLYGVSTRPQMRERKGRRFELDLGKWISQMLPDAKSLFKPNMELKSQGSVYGEVDLSFQCGVTAYVVDCKAYRVSPACLRGDREALKMRWDYTEGWLSQVIRTTSKLARQPKGDNYELPDNVKYLIPLVCSANVEPVYSIDDKHFVASDIPRVCTPLELVDLLGLDHSLVSTPNDYVFSVAERLE